jgi:integrase
LTVKPPKSKSSIRKVPLTSSFTNLLKTYIENDKTRYLDQKKTMSDTSVFFSNSVLNYQDCSRVRKDWKKLCKKIGIENIQFKQLRATFFSLLDKNGVPLKTASILGGHSSVLITSKYYVYSFNGEKEKAVSKLDYLIT